MLVSKVIYSQDVFNVTVISFSWGKGHGLHLQSELFIRGLKRGILKWLYRGKLVVYQCSHLLKLLGRGRYVSETFCPQWGRFVSIGNLFLLLESFLLLLL